MGALVSRGEHFRLHLVSERGDSLAEVGLARRKGTRGQLR
uniref:Uncharacterized protein n=1 Tax=viral metagenome TaxID=1070528 RepID=A0A6C0CHD0_9ZZZZ